MTPQDAQDKIVDTVEAAVDCAKTAITNPIKTAEVVLVTPIRVAQGILNVFGF